MHWASFLHKQVLNFSELKSRFDLRPFVLAELIVHKLITVDQALLLIEKGMSDSSESIRFFVKTMKSFKFLVVENLITVDQVLPLIEREMSSLDYNVRFFGMEEIKSLADKDLITADQALPFFEKGMNDIDSNVRYSAVEAIKSLVDKTMITQSELEYLQKAATDTSVGKQLKELKLSAPASRAARAETVKPESELLKNQKEHEQLLLRQEEEQRVRATQEKNHMHAEQPRPEFAGVR